MKSLLSTAGLARLSSRHPWKVLSFWFLLIVIAGILAPSLGDALTTESKFTNRPDSIVADDLLEARLRGERPMTETIVIRSETATVDDAQFRATVDGVMAELNAMPEIVVSAANYYGTGSEALVSQDRHSTIIPITLAGDLDGATENVDELLGALSRASVDGFQILTVGDASLNDELSKIAEEDMATGERIGVPVAIIILIVVLGALIAAGLPIAIGLISVFIAIGMAAVVGRFFDLSFFIVNMIGMIGLAVGIDYSLFVISRYREERRRGRDKLTAIEIAGGTASKAVLFSGMTVIFALSGMFIAPGTVFRSVGLGAVLVVIVAIFATLMLMPALLSLLGDKLDWPRKPKYDEKMAAAQAAHDLETIHSGFWGTITRIVMARPIVSIGLAAGLLIALSIPYLDVKQGSVGVSGIPSGAETRAAYDLLQRDFAAGTVAPVEIAIDGDKNDPSVVTAIDHLTGMLQSDAAFGPVTITWNEPGDLALVSAPLTFAPDSTEAFDTIERLRDEVVPMAFANADAEVYVTGQSAYVQDFNEVTSRFTPLVFAFVLGLSFVLLLIAFRSIVVPAKAIVMNLLSVGAAYGSIVLVFQKGYGAGLLGFQKVEAIEMWLPLFLFCVLFGLSMDYHVFLLSRIKEHYDATKRNGESVAVGLQATAKLITGAALIMVAVFGGFAAGRLVSLQQVGFGLAIAVFLDATVVRSVLVPASMALLGDRNWYLPKWLEWLPNFNIEGAEQPAPAAVPALKPVAVPVFGVATASGDD
jgi:RND superfamily putative drug exporter